MKTFLSIFILLLAIGASGFFYINNHKELLELLKVTYYNLTPSQLMRIKAIASSLILLISILSFLIQNNKKVNGKSNKELKEILELIEKKDLNMFKNYLANKKLEVKDLNKINCRSQPSPLLYSIKQDSFEIYKYLLMNGIDVNYVHKNYGSAIFHIVHFADKKYMKELLRYCRDKIDLNFKSKDFNASPLEIAIWRNKVEMVKVLLQYGAKFSLESYNKSTCAETLSFKNFSIEIKKLLLKQYVLKNIKIQQFNLIDKCASKALNLKIFNHKPYINENFLLTS